MSIRIEYEIRQDETNVVESTGSKEFENTDAYYSWLESQHGHRHIKLTQI